MSAKKLLLMLLLVVAISLNRIISFALESSHQSPATTHLSTFDTSFQSYNTISIVAIITANMWIMTQNLLTSMAATADEFKLVVVDELSNDNTTQRLRSLNITVLTPPKPNGVTYNWNLAYMNFLSSEYLNLFIINNDALIPNGAIKKLEYALDPQGKLCVIICEHHQNRCSLCTQFRIAQKIFAGGDCDLVIPTSTKKGMGAWKKGCIEALYHLPPKVANFVSNPLNYQKVQKMLDEVAVDQKTAIRELKDLNSTFSGKFLFCRRRIRGIKIIKKILS
jgi:glycosyltransferase involved in cell wall biosynthesis